MPLHIFPPKHRPLSSFRFIPALIVLGLALPSPSRAGLAGENLDFENGFSNWMVHVVCLGADGKSVDSEDSQGRAQIVPKGSHDGTKPALHIDDDRTDAGWTVETYGIPAQPGKRYRLTFDARCTTGAFRTTVKLIFRAADGTELQSPKEVLIGSSADNSWHSYECEGIAGTNTAFVKIWIHTSTKEKVVVDLSDLNLTVADPAGGSAANFPSAQSFRIF